jgi:uncharacterized protein (TIGR02391 family)
MRTVNLEAKISQRLWGEVRSNYEGRNFTGAILDSIYFLSNLVRQKTGLEADGVSLAGQAFGGKNPKLKVNKLQTESEWNVQQGVEQIMRGVYHAFRNPRSHEKTSDTQEDADSIIVFIDYLLKVIDQSKTCFSKAAFLPRVFDPDFFANERYAALLAEEVPPKQRLEVFVEVFEKRETGDCAKLMWFLQVLYGKLTCDGQTQALDLISEELKTADTDAKIRTAIQVLPASAWPNLSEVARLRIENKFINSVKEGKYVRNTGTCRGGALGTWSGGLFSHFSLKNQMALALAHKLASADVSEQDYVFQYFSSRLAELAPAPGMFLVHTIKQGLAKGDKRFLNLAMCFDAPYSAPLEKELKEFKEHPPDDAAAQVEPPPEWDDVPF